MENLEQRVFLIFDKTYPNEGINRYLALVKELNASKTIVDGSFENALFQFQRIGMTFTNEVYSFFPNAAELFHKASLEESRSRKLLAYLGEMICYWFQREYHKVRQIQSNVSSLEFNSTWWERNKKNVTGLAGGLLAAACALAGGASTQVAGMGGIKSGQALINGSSDIEIEENDFIRLKNAICKINFPLA